MQTLTSGSKLEKTELDGAGQGELLDVGEALDARLEVALQEGLLLEADVDEGVLQGVHLQHDLE